MDKLAKALYRIKEIDDELFFLNAKDNLDKEDHEYSRKLCKEMRKLKELVKGGS